MHYSIANVTVQKTDNNTLKMVGVCDVDKEV